MLVPISGETLKNLRGLRHLSQQGLADRSGVSKATIVRIESSQPLHSCNAVSAGRLAKALEVEVHDLAEDNFKRVIDVGGDVELHLDRIVDIDELRRANRNLEDIVEMRNRFLKK